MLTLLHEKTVGYTGYVFCFKAISSGSQKKLIFPAFVFLIVFHTSVST